MGSIACLDKGADGGINGYVATDNRSQSDVEAETRLPRNRLSELYAENITAKILRTAVEHLEKNNPPFQYPEIVPQSGEHKGLYQSRSIDFWTCGFFPGCIYSLLERLNEYPQSMRSSTNNGANLVSLRRRLEDLGRIWSDPIHGEARLTNTHDMGFIMMPHMRPRWKMYHDHAALASIVTSAKNLSTRFSDVVGAIRSWDPETWQLVTNGRGMQSNYIVIIDSLMNLDLLFYAAAQTGEERLRSVAIAHARTLLQSHIRPEPLAKRHGYTDILYSSRHVVNFCPKTGSIQERLTAQGYNPDSTWSRGQAWAVTGYTQAYVWTGLPEFLNAACGLAEYFLLQLETAPPCVETESCGKKTGRYVPLWDFSAPVEMTVDGGLPLRDTSAGMCAANGLLMLSQTLMSQGKHSLGTRYLEGALKIVEDTLQYSLASEKACIVAGEDGELMGVDVEKNGNMFEAILKNATVAANPNTARRIMDHGLVYADYYLIEFGTRLLKMGMY